MEKPTGLADLKLVNKYYPIANYSYPSPKIEGQAATAVAAAIERMGDRSSVDSQASVPGMVDDRESVISIEEDHVHNDRDQYHISGAELWDSFWEDPFWEANAEEASHETDSITRKIIHRNTSYPALIPSPDSSCRKDHYFGEGSRRHEDVIVSAFNTYSSSSVVATIATTTWPLIASEVPVAPRPLTPKTNYSLFPRTTSAAAVNPPSSRPPTLSPGTWSSWETPRRKTGSTVSLTSLNRTSKPKQLLLGGAHTLDQTSWAQSAPVTPVVAGLTPPLSSSSPSTSPSSASSSSISPATEISAERRDSILSINQRPRIPVNLPRTRSETIVSRSSIRSIYSIRTNKSQLDLSTPPAIPPRPRSPELPPPAPQQGSSSNRFSQIEVPVKIHTQIPLHRCRTETSLATLRQRRSQASILTVATTCTITPVSSSSTTATTPPPPPTPEPVSVFEVDSDSEVEEESFARRIARSFTSSSKRTRSASAAPRSRKGAEVAKGQLSRARAETLEAPWRSSGLGVASTSDASGDDKEERKGSSGSSILSVSGGQPTLLRRQKSEVFGKMLWGRR